MKILTVVSASIVLLLTPMSMANAAEIRVLAGGAMMAVWGDLKPKFEQATGHKLSIFFGTTPNVIKEATSGHPFDVGVVPVEVMMDSAARSRFKAGPTLDIARVGLAVAVRAGAPKPDISIPDAFKAALLNASSVASIPESATGYSIAKVFDRLDIAEPMKAKMKAQPSPARVVAVVVNGEADLALFLMNVLNEPGLDVVGPFPADLQQEVVFTAAPAAETKEAEAGIALIQYLKSPEAASVVKRNGMTPG